MDISFFKVILLSWLYIHFHFINFSVLLFQVHFIFWKGNKLYHKHWCIVQRWCNTSKIMMAKILEITFPLPSTPGTDH